MKGFIYYKYAKQNLKAAISNAKLWREEYEKHTRDFPNEVAYKERLELLLSNAHKMILPAIEFLDVSELHKEFSEKLYKEKLLIERILGIL